MNFNAFLHLSFLMCSVLCNNRLDGSLPTSGDNFISIAP